jgi:hypothetical protein
VSRSGAISPRRLVTTVRTWAGEQPTTAATFSLAIPRRTRPVTCRRCNSVRAGVRAFLRPSLRITSWTLRWDTGISPAMWLVLWPALCSEITRSRPGVPAATLELEDGAMVNIRPQMLALGVLDRKQKRQPVTADVLVCERYWTVLDAAIDSPFR